MLIDVDGVVVAAAVGGGRGGDGSAFQTCLPPFHSAAQRRPHSLRLSSLSRFCLSRPD